MRSISIISSGNTASVIGALKGGNTIETDWRTAEDEVAVVIRTSPRRMHRTARVVAAPLPTRGECVRVSPARA
jgi:hypothetical protein